MQDYQQNRKTAGAFGQTSYGAPAAQTTSLFGAQATTQQPTTGSIFGGGTTGAFGTTTQPSAGAFGAFGQQQPATGASTGTSIFGGGPAFAQSQQQQQQQQQPSTFGAFGQQQQPVASTGAGIFGGTSPFGQPKPPTGFGGSFGQSSECLLMTVLLSI